MARSGAIRWAARDEAEYGFDYHLALLELDHSGLSLLEAVGAGSVKEWASWTDDTLVNLKDLRRRLDGEIRPLLGLPHPKECQ